MFFGSGHSWIEQLLTASAAVAAGFLAIVLFRDTYLKRTQSWMLGCLPTAILATLAILRVLELFGDFNAVSQAEFVARRVVDVVLIALLCAFVWRRWSARALASTAVLEAVEEQLYYQKLFYAFMEEAPAIVALKDEHLRVVYINSYLKELFGIDPQKLIGQRTTSWGLLTQADEVEKQDRKIIQSGVRTDFLQELTIHGITRTMNLTKFPVGGIDQGIMVGLVGIDITDQLSRKARIDALAASIELSMDAIYCYDENGIVLYWNAGAERLYGYRRAEMLEHSIEEIIPPDRTSDVAWIVAKLRTDGVIRNFETLRIDKLGVVKSVVIAATRTFDATGKMLCALTARDVTPMKAIQNCIATTNEALASQVQELSVINSHLKVASNDALQASTLKSAFIANVSHELRTPVSGILGMSELILRESSLDSDDYHVVELIHESSKVLLMLVNDILDLSKLDAGKTVIESQFFSPEAVMRDCVSLIAPAAEARKLQLKLFVGDNLPDLVNGDYGKIRQVLLSLLSNAVKFTKAGRIVVDVRTRVGSGHTSEIIFSVSDTGIGISPENEDSIFTPFSRIVEQHGPPGIGLGLAVAKRFVGLMGGTISFRSRVGKGSKFWFTIPFQSTSVQSATGKAVTGVTRRFSPEELAGCHVLSVEDSPVLAQLTRRQLKLLGVSVDTASTGTEAINKASQGDFDIILMDVHLPDISGYDATRSILSVQDRLGKRKPTIIAMTAATLEDEREDALAAGMDDFLAKPVTIEQLRATVCSWLDKRKTA